MGKIFEASYYHFEATGCQEIDDILEAVALAGRNYHHTSEWQDPCFGPSPVQRIQEAANKAAKRMQEKE